MVAVLPVSCIRIVPHPGAGAACRTVLLPGKEASLASDNANTARPMNAPFPHRKPESDDGAFVERFLRANPGWLAERLELYRVLTPPARVHGERLADHMAAMLRAERAHAA